MSSAKFDVDALLASVGSFGPYQRMLFVLLSVPAGLTALVTMASVFTMAVPAQRCFVDHCDDVHHAKYGDYTHFAFALPRDEHTERPKFCQAFEYVGNASRVLDETDLNDDMCLADAFDHRHSVECRRQLFDKADFENTVVTEFALTCHQAWKVPLVTSVFFGGVLIFSPLYGLLADNFGRRPTLLTSLLLTSIFTLLASWARSYFSFVCLMLLAGVGQVGVFQTAFILVVESVESEWRVFCGIVIEYFFVLGELVLALVAHFTRNWRLTLRLSSLPFFALGLMNLVFLPESLRWLLNRGRREEAEIVFDKLLKVNGVQGTINFDDYRSSQDEQESTLNSEEDDVDVEDNVAIVSRSEGVWDLLCSGTLVLRAFILAFCWMVVSMTYFGLSLNSGQLAGNPYINFGLVAIVEIPGYSLSYWTMQRLGRRPSVSISLILGGVSCVVSGLVAELNLNMPLLQLLAFLSGKMGVTSAFGTIYLYTSELYPTPLRTLGVGVSSMCARFGSILAPYVTALAIFDPLLPMVVFGVLALLSGLTVLFLPETLGKHLPETISDAVHLGRRHENTVLNEDDRSQRSTEDEDDRDEAARQEEETLPEDKPLIVA